MTKRKTGRKGRAKARKEQAQEPVVPPARHPDVIPNALTPKQELFVLEYLKDFNGKAAAIRAGYSERTAESQASRLLRNVKVSAAVEVAKEVRKERVRIETDRLEQEAERIAVSDIRQLLDENGYMRPLKDWPDELAAAIASIEVVTKKVGEGEIEHIAKVRFWDKPSAIGLIFKVRGHGLVNDKNLNVKGGLSVDLQASFDQGVAEAKEMTDEVRRAQVAEVLAHRARMEALKTTGVPAR